eukprot:TRINITY_DN1009_c0_g1_i2.p2 TRINITY_DN1009_c0_g1~~TRINITY_DN1009_c0_g1_i2.p2  ORF type:complete len:247 (+),score=70.48 TRINITY_DN1009_c0_g1_i2:160-900(+)
MKSAANDKKKVVFYKVPQVNYDQSNDYVATEEFKNQTPSLNMLEAHPITDRSGNNKASYEMSAEFCATERRPMLCNKDVVEATEMPLETSSIGVNSVEKNNEDEQIEVISNKQILNKKEDSTKKESIIKNAVERLHVSRDKQLARALKNREQREKAELESFTGRPQISTKAQRLFDSASKVKAWNSRMTQHRAQRMQELVEEKSEKARRAAKPCSVSKGSVKYLESMGRLERKERIELSLLRRGQE